MGILQEIVEYKKSSLKKSYSYFDELLGRIKEAKPSLSLKGAILSSKATKTPIIAEIKQASPSMGHIKNVDIKEQAYTYQEAGACAISVLTDDKFFGGKLDYLEEVKSVVEIPVMRKDFIIDPIQVYEARAYKADAILLIARILDKYQIEDISYEAKKLGLEILMEIFEEHEIEKVKDFEIIGVNNRDLDTLDVDIAKSKEMLPILKENTKAVLISESGIFSKDDINFLEGYDGFLVGTSIMKEDNPAQKLKELVW
ncbi:MAG: indole-3-glycerol phosphate synthase TrpC [Hydrogenobaculum sp.]|nr:MAG: indole-3-glycerol-phosphate synthase [Hydrogenobaculum sp.]